VTNLKQYLADEIKNWEFIGHAALMQRFVLRNGREYTPTARIGKKGTPKQCFQNATQAVLARPIRDLPVRERWRYVEGYCISRVNPIMAFHHAWIAVDGDKAMDPTLDAEQYEYIGIEFPKPNVVAWMKELGYYGILDTGRGLNIKLMFGMDPELKTIVDAVKPHAKWLEAQQAVR
jgi:hypothetical protein